MPRAIGLAALTVLEPAPPDIVSGAARAAYDCVGLRLLPATPTEIRHTIVGDTPMLRETAVCAFAIAGIVRTSGLRA
ncbi:MAG: hypothetical protein ACM338_09885 [Betaproteobacteria bacterium]